ncbi:TetR/AcrR family transcriptional regulator [Puia sp.]|jgi:TetR/AcrR family transcriptional repressor of nem operon|uniref:TetR/AcrR family transcriptional regulator n=1 Tax=Puia sp. TaxID=2045100 RepID=UPI002F411ABF
MPRTKSFNEEDTLDKAKEVFWQKGYNGTPPQDILEGTGLSRSSLYDTYGDKRTLFIKTLNRYRQCETAGAIQYLDESADPVQAIRRVFQGAYEALMTEQPRRGCLMVNTLSELAPHDEEVESIVRENRQALEDAYMRTIKRGQRLGQIAKSHQPRALARYLLNSLWGLTTNLKLGLDKKAADDIVRITLSVL